MNNLLLLYVGGLQGNPLSYKGKASGLWKNLDSGIYQVDTISEDGPSGAYQYGNLIVVKGNKTDGFGMLIYKPVGTNSKFLYIAGFAIYSSAVSLRNWEVYSAV